MDAKSIYSFLAACILMAIISAANEKRWATATERAISSGVTTISTTKEKRAHLAQEIAEKHGRTTKILPIENGYRVVVD